MLNLKWKKLTFVMFIIFFTDLPGLPGCPGAPGWPGGVIPGGPCGPKIANILLYCLALTLCLYMFREEKLLMSK